MLHPHLSFRSRSSAVGLGLSIAGAVFLTGCASAPKEAPPAQLACPAGVSSGRSHGDPVLARARLSGLALFAGQACAMERCAGGACARRSCLG